jgi:hypothetical protein
MINWTSDFFDDKSHQEIIRNVHPRPGESSSYVPTAKGWATGQSFATISFVQNPVKMDRHDFGGCEWRRYWSGE